MNRIFIINPKSGSGVSSQQLNSLRERFRCMLGSFDYVLTTSAQDVETQTRASLRAGADQIIVLGGDGTLNWAINGFFEKKEIGDTASFKPIRPESILTVAKWGTGSDYYKTVTEKYKTASKAPPHWENLILEHSPKTVDLGVVQFTNPSGKTEHRLFINIASSGAGAVVADRKNNQRIRLPKTFAYFPATIQTAATFKTRKHVVSIDGKTMEKDLFAIFFAKGIYSGGGMRFGGLVAPDDGLLGVTLIPKMPFAKLMKYLPYVFKGQWEKIPEVIRVPAKTVTIESTAESNKKAPPAGSAGNFDFPLEVEGEVVGYVPLKLSVLPKCIKVAFPP